MAYMQRPIFYITTPIYYVNDKPHIGHAYSTIAADVLARYQTLRGRVVIFLTGTDENSQKNVEAAKKAGIEDMTEYLNMQSAIWQRTWDQLNITNTDFIRTTEPRHKAAVEKFFHAVNAKGDIYKGKYQGYYCGGCEEFKLEGDLIDGKCPIHLKVVETIEEDNYFFAASKYRDALLAHIEENPDFIQPSSRRHEVVNYIKDHFSDVSISRQSLKWGIPLPIDSTHVVYVWFDALINYLTAAGYGRSDELFETVWPADLHIVGKDIIKFHCALWPAMLMAADLPLPKRVFANGFFTMNGQKISKSLDNAIDPLELGKQYGLDAVRYFLLREIPFGQDGDFSYERLAQRYEADLAKGLGNFASRVVTLAEKAMPLTPNTGSEAEAEIKALVAESWAKIDAELMECRFDDALATIWALLRWGDRYIEQMKPWALAKEQPEEFVAVMSLLVELLRQVSLMVYPVLPETAEIIWQHLGCHEVHQSQKLEVSQVWRGVIITGLEKLTPLFPPVSLS